MAHRYARVIHVTLADGQPASFEWRGTRYPITDVLTTWRLRDRWWDVTSADAGGTQPPIADTLVPMPAADTTGGSDRTYYRVRCVASWGEQIFDLYYDAVDGHWVLDRAHD